ncbi:MAG: SpoIID/LytB domain-containing protein, partial [Muribaculaceae bacterium]|nr:SpoIID/LytB domain-containing protein [Muribaculaceae bacterium]
ARVVNRAAGEEHLRASTASEMAATSSVELLKAHAVISRSWLMAQMRVTRALASRGAEVDEPESNGGEEIVRWYDRDDHVDFDVCAADHCQRYQGALRASTPQVDEAIAATCGMVLADADGLIADARFSKCCGGVTELFENCWQPRHHSYLVPIYDAAGADAPTCFCSTRDSDVLRQVLNDFDRDTTPDFYRWTVAMGQRELSELVKRKSGIDFGLITELMPLHRGPSGRITRLRITGTKRTVVVGKELEIRRWLSESHLRSSAFSVERGADGSFTLHGAGWGHGVGLCQIGAAVMASQGYDYRKILAHYFPTTHIIRLYR